MNPTPYRPWDSEVFILRAPSLDGLLREVHALTDALSKKPAATVKDLSFTVNSRTQSLPCCLAIVASSLEDLAGKLSQASKRIAEPETKEIRSKKGIYFSRRPLSREGKLAFLFPGEGSQYAYMLRDLCLHFPSVRACFDRMDRAFVQRELGESFLPSEIVFPPSLAAGRRAHPGADEDLWRMAGAVAAVLTANQALLELLQRLRILPNAVVGHSTGEYTALQASGILDLNEESRYQEYIGDLHKIYRESAARGEIPRARLVAVGSDLDKVRTVLEKIQSNLHLAMDNCPHQVVILGADAEVQRAIEEFSRQGIIHQTLPFDRPYHSPMFEAYARNLESFFEKWLVNPPRLPIYSCNTVEPFPADLKEARKLALEHWVRPVRFRQTIERMYEDGFRIFVEAGPRGNLTAFVNDTLRNRDHLAVASDTSSRSGISQLQHLVALLSAHGVPMSLDALYEDRKPGPVLLDRELAPGHGQAPAPREAMKIELEVPRLRLGADYVPRPSTASPRLEDRREVSSQPAESAREQGSTKHTAPDPVLPFQEKHAANAMEAYFKTMERFLQVQQEVMRCYLSGEEAQDVELPSLDLSEHLKFLRGEATAEPNPRIRLQEASSAQTEERGSSFDGAKSEGLQAELLSLVSEKTGYPVEMLDAGVNLEADLGIDSIKRIEILGALWERHPVLPREDLEKATALKTLAEVIAFLDGSRERMAHPNLGLAVPNTPGIREAQEGLPDPGRSAGLPLIGDVISWKPGETLHARRCFDLKEDVFLRHHTIGGPVSKTNPESLALPVMPLTMSMEMMAEAACLLMPDRFLVGMKDIRAHRWIALDRNPLTLEVSARRKSGSEEEVEVFLLDPDEDTNPPGRHLVEGTMVFGARYPEAPQTGSQHLKNERASRWRPEELYSERMFHGPCWQGVSSIDRWGEDGSAATFVVLPKDGFFDPPRSSRFVTDPVVLDAAGQIVGFWTMEHLEEGFLVFPYRVKALHIYRPQVPPHERIRCLARIRLVGSRQVFSDIDMIGEDGRLWMRLEGWEDKRFGLPASAYSFLLSPTRVIPSLRWDAPIASLPDADGFFCVRLDGLFKDDEAFWTQVFSHLILNQTEREIFARLGKSAKRRAQWLVGRLLAKDAVRMVLRERHGMEIPPADIEIRQDEHGRPNPWGAWAHELEQVPCLSIAHTNGMCMAVAGPARGDRSVGVDIEQVRPLGEGFEAAAFTPAERMLLRDLNGSERQEWTVRFWSAKEAASKALGRGLLDGPHGLVVQHMDMPEGRILVRPEGRLAEHFPDLLDQPIRVYTLREDDYIVASTVVQRSRDDRGH